ncbi:transglutaminase-like domain-containing protein [Rhizobium laguerreae]|uniref:transglutaminase-like domain-containing protein n=1 Tax=Rhizobium laguerreae TaxID=1076926 RepID=UPI003D7C7AF6
MRISIGGQRLRTTPASIAASAITYPFSYGEHEWKDLGGLREVQYADPSDLFRQWIGAFVRTSPTDTLSLLKDLSGGVSNEIAYQSREAEGTQSPLEPLRLRSGTCRDFAVLFAEAGRVLGFAARNGVRIPLQPQSLAYRLK